MKILNQLGSPLSARGEPFFFAQNDLDGSPAWLRGCEAVVEPDQERAF